MSIIDNDSTSSNRNSPTLNVNDDKGIRRAHNTYGNTLRRAGGSVTPRMAFKNGLLLTYDSANRVSSVYGYIPEVSTIPVFIIAKDGYDIFTDILEISAPTV